jgi:hypothetical protein
MVPDPSNEVSRAGDTGKATADQLLRGVIVVGILLATPSLVFHVVMPLVMSHVLGVFIAVPLLATMGVGIYTIAEGELPAVVGR